MTIDYIFTVHYDANDDCSVIHQHGYIIKFNSERAIQFAIDNFNIDAEIGVEYKFDDDDLWDSLRNAFGKADNHFIGTINDDDWPFYAIRNKEYWEAIYGEGYIEKIYPLIGISKWNSTKDILFKNV